MVKSQKQLEGQLVAAWRDDYENFKQLKKDIRQIREEIASKKHHLVTNKHSGCSSLIIHHKIRESSSGSKEMVYNTELVYEKIPWAEHDRVFFSRLDTQLNRFNNSYRAKQNEYLVRGQQLRGQLETLIHTKRALAKNKIYDHSTGQEIDIEDGESASAYRHKVVQAEKVLRKTSIENYKGITLLQNYSSLNTLAFVKILKKYDKVTGRSVMDTYLREVQDSYFSTRSEKVLHLMESVKILFTNYFSKNNRTDAMNSGDQDAFSLGFFVGCSVGYLLALVLVLFQHHISSRLS